MNSIDSMLQLKGERTVNNKLLRFITPLCALLAANVCTAAETDGLVYELRTYTTNEGMLPALHARFRDHTMRIFEKHGMQNIGYWVPTDKPNTLVYIIAHESRAAADASWQAFGADPEWRKVAADSQKNGPILIRGGVQRQFLTPTDYSPSQ